MPLSNTPAAVASSSLHPGAPQMLHHVTYVTYDSKATADFYTRVMGMPLVCTVMDDHLPSTGNRTPYFHTFFRLGDGSTIAFLRITRSACSPAAAPPGLRQLQPFGAGSPQQARRRHVEALARGERDRGAARRSQDHLQHLLPRSEWCPARDHDHCRAFLGRGPSGRGRFVGQVGLREARHGRIERRDRPCAPAP